MDKNIYLTKKIEELNSYIEKANDPEFIGSLKRRIAFLEKCLDLERRICFLEAK